MDVPVAPLAESRLEKKRQSRTEMVVISLAAYEMDIGERENSAVSMKVA